MLMSFGRRHGLRGISATMYDPRVGHLIEEGKHA